MMEKKNYRNVFAEIGISEETIQKRLEEVKQFFFYGGEDKQVYYPVGDDMAYIMDVGSNDVRTEGMSYGMMFCVQLDMKEEFDRLWKWAKTYMYMEDGLNGGFFSWSCSIDGNKNDPGPASDGEEFFAMSLFFASHRWGDGEGIFEYSKQAREILHDCLHNGRGGRGELPMWNLENYQIKFVPTLDFTDPSYFLPHFYELFALWANEEDREFWKKAADEGRDFLTKTCHPVTGFSPEYAEYDGSPMCRKFDWMGDRHDWFFSDSYRTVANIGLDYEWFGIDKGQCAAAANIQKYLIEYARKNEYYKWEIDGTKAVEESIYNLAIPVTVAQSVLAAETEYSKEWVEKFWNLPMNTGTWRYYDNCLYMFAFLALSGNYRIW